MHALFYFASSLGALSLPPYLTACPHILQNDHVIFLAPLNWNFITISYSKIFVIWKHDNIFY